MSEPKPTPSTLATLAALIALQDAPDRRKPVKNYFDDATALINEADSYLRRPEFRMSHLDALKEFTFAEVITIVSPPENGQKKARTMVGSITTGAGLRKAIRRVFKASEAKTIIENGYLLKNQIDQIISNKSRLNSLRTEKANRAKKRRSKKSVK